MSKPQQIYVKGCEGIIGSRVLDSGLCIQQVYQPGGAGGFANGYLCQGSLNQKATQDMFDQPNVAVLCPLDGHVDPLYMGATHNAIFARNGAYDNPNKQC